LLLCDNAWISIGHAFVLPTASTRVGVPGQSTTASTVTSVSTSTQLFGLKNNKQVALAAKMALAKKQQQQAAANEDPKDTPVSSSMHKEQEDDPHAEFAKLLANSKPPPKSSDGGGGGGGGGNIKFEPGPLGSNISKFKPKKKETTVGQPRGGPNKQASPEEEEEEEFSPLQVGDRSRRRDFELLTNVTSGIPLGAMQAAQLVPWVPPFVTDYLVVVADPRPRSLDLRRAIEYLHSTYHLGEEQDARIRFTAVVADDATQETAAWMTRVGIVASDFAVLQDGATNLDDSFLTTYGCREGQWSLHALVMDNDGMIRLHETDVDPSNVCAMVKDGIASLDECSKANNNKGKKK